MDKQPHAVGDVVRSYMAEREISFRMMAEQLNDLVDYEHKSIISHQTLANWSDGTNLPSVDILARILTATTLDDWRGQFVRDVLATLFPALISHTERFE